MTKWEQKHFADSAWELKLQSVGGSDTCCVQCSLIVWFLGQIDTYEQYD